MPTPFTPFDWDRYTIVDPLTGKRYPRVAGGDGPTDPPTLVQLVEQAEGDLSALSADELAALRVSLTEAYTAARANVTSDDEVEALGTVTAAVTRIDGEVETRATAAAAREERLAELDAQVLTPVAEADDAGGEPGDDEGDDADGGDGGDTNVDVTIENTTDVPAAEAEVVHTPELVTASAPVRRPPPNLSILNTQRPEPTPEPDSRDDGSLRLRGRIVASADSALIARGQSFSDPERLGEVIEARARELRVPAPSQAKHYIGQVVIADRPNVVKQADHNLDDGSIIDLAVRRNTDARLASAMAALSSTDRRVAAGGVCVPAQPDYTITTVGDRGAAWVDTLPTIQGNRPISFWRWINMSLTAAPGSRVGARPATGIGVVTAAQDLAGYGGTNRAGVESDIPEGGVAFKDCVHIDCPTPVTEAPEAIFSCTCVGNFAAITWPEYVRVFDETVGFYFDVARDEGALAKFVAFAKNLSSEAPAFGASRDLLDRMRRLVAHVRSVRKAPNMTFTFAVPGFARYMVAQDLADSLTESSGGWLSAGQALARLAIDEGIMIDEYNVSIGATADGSATVLPELTDGTALPDWPSEIRILAYPEGGVFRHDYGSLNFGLRETVVETNDFCAFYETFESIAFRTTDLFTLDVPLCVNGALGATVEKLCEAS